MSSIHYYRAERALRDIARAPKWRRRLLRRRLDRIDRFHWRIWKRTQPAISRKAFMFMEMAKAAYFDERPRRTDLILDSLQDLESIVAAP